MGYSNCRGFAVLDCILVAVHMYTPVVLPLAIVPLRAPLLSSTGLEAELGPARNRAISAGTVFSLVAPDCMILSCCRICRTGEVCPGPRPLVAACCDSGNKPRGLRTGRGRSKLAACMVAELLGALPSPGELFTVMTGAGGGAKGFSRSNQERWVLRLLMVVLAGIGFAHLENYAWEDASSRCLWENVPWEVRLKVA